MTHVRAPLLVLGGLLLTGLLVAACGGSAPLLGGVAATPAVLLPTGQAPTEPIRLAYTLGRLATVSLRVHPAAGGADIVLRPAASEPAGAHFVLFTGVVPLTATPGAAAAPVARVLPDGAYRFLVTVLDASGQQQEAGSDFHIQGAQTQPPALDNLQVYPATISPNGDAIADVASITYRLAQTCTASVTLQGAGGTSVPVFAPAQLPAGEQQVTFAGQDLLEQPVPDGVYTVTVRAEDRAGNAVEARRPLTIAGSGTPNISLLQVKIDPPALLLGGRIHVHFVVQNTGKVTLRTQGPDSGFTYTTNDSYASIAGGRYVDQAGLWRVGLDWQGNTGGAPYRYPFRWGFGGPLAPGATATIDGYVTVLKHERTMWWYAGVLQEGVRIVQDQLALTPVQVSW